MARDRLQPLDALLGVAAAVTPEEYAAARLAAIGSGQVWSRLDLPHEARRLRLDTTGTAGAFLFGTHDGNDRLAVRLARIKRHHPGRTGS
jgi:hypothetical protein